MTGRQFHELLRDIFEDRVKNQDELAQRLGYSQGYVSKILTGKKPPSQSFILALRDKLDFSAQEIFELFTTANLSVPQELKSEAGLATVEAESAVISALHDTSIPPDVKQHLIDDLRTVIDGWRAYQEIQQRNSHRDWEASSRVANQRLEDIDRLHLRLSSYLKVALVRAQSHLGDAEKAQRSLERLAAAGAQLDDLRLVTLSHMYQGNVYRDSGRWKDAILEYERAQEVYDRLGDSVSSYEAELSIAIARLFGGEYERALTSLQRCLDVFRSNDLTALCVRTHYALAWAYNLSGAWDLSLEHHQEGLELAQTELPSDDRATKYRIMLGNSYLGNDYRQRREPDKALVAYQTAYEMVKEFGDTREFGWILMGLARVHGQLALRARATGTREEATDHRNKAIAFFDEALTHNFQIGFWYRQAMAKTHYARFLLDYSDEDAALDQATRLLQEALTHAETAGSQYYRAHACVWLCECYRRRRDRRQFDGYVKDVEALREIAQYELLLARLRLIQAHFALDQELSAAVPFVVEAFESAIRHHSLTATEMQNRLGRIITDDLLKSYPPEQLHEFLRSIAARLEQRFRERRHFDENQRRMRSDVMDWLEQTAEIVLQRGMISVEPFD